jgi:argininosuccinate synthase
MGKKVKKIVLAYSGGLDTSFYVGYKKTIMQKLLLTPQILDRK